MNTKPYRWTKYRRALRAFLEHPDAPQEVDAAWAMLEQGLIDRAREHGARPSEIAMGMSRDRSEFYEVARRIGRLP